MANDSSTSNDTEPCHPVLRRDQTLAIVFGASEWPFYPDFHAAPSFRRSATEIADYFRDRHGLNLPRRNVKVLIDSFDDAPEILREMRGFIRERRDDLNRLGNPATDLLVYYVGHGGFADSDAFFLSIRSTDESDPLATSITADSLGRLIREGAAGLRSYLVLDCCFAASVTKVFMSGGPLGVAEAQLHDALPPLGDAPASQAGRTPAYGTALLCASGPREPAKAPPDLSHTMFTGGLLEVLRHGDPTAPPWLSLDDMQRLVRRRLEARFADKAVLPQVHVPQQRMGRVDQVPLFRNSGWIPPATSPNVQGQAIDNAIVTKDSNGEALVSRAKELESIGRFKEAADTYKATVILGNLDAMTNLGRLYRIGRGVPKSYVEAARLYKLAADRGYAIAQSSLAQLYLEGWGVQQSDTEAVRLYRLAAEQDNEIAQFNLGNCYQRGRGVTRSRTDAVYWYRLAARQDMQLAQTVLRQMGEVW
jgi:hypothetical protein